MSFCFWSGLSVLRNGLLKRKVQLMELLVYFIGFLLLIRSMDIKIKQLGHQHYDIAVSYVNLQNLCLQRKQYETGLEYARKAWDIYVVIYILMYQLLSSFCVSSKYVFRIERLGYIHGMYVLCGLLKKHHPPPPFTAFGF